MSTNDMSAECEGCPRCDEERQLTTCEHCGEPIEWEEGERAELNNWQWRHTYGQRTRSGSLPLRCSGYPCEDEATPARKVAKS